MSRSTRSITAGIVAFAALAPAAVAMPQDGPLGGHRSSQSGVRTSSLAGTYSARDLRSPDARDAALAAERHLQSSHIVTSTIPSTPTTHFVQVKAADGFDWTDAVIGAGGAFGAFALVAGSGVALRRRVRHSLAS